MKKVLLFAAMISLAAVSCSKKQAVDSADQPESNVMLPEPSPSAEASATASAAASSPASGSAAASGAAGAPNAQAIAQGETLVKNAGCLSCHAVDKKVVGPSYDDVAKRYTDKDIDMLVDKIIKGGAGHWGDVPMSPHPGLSKENAKLMVEYILSLKGKA